MSGKSFWTGVILVIAFSLATCLLQTVALSDFVKADQYRASAEQGDAKAQAKLGLCYVKGSGVTQDSAEAVKWFRKAADQGYARAQYDLGVCYWNGSGVTRDRAEAVRWFRKAADQGDAKAQYWLGRCYYKAEFGGHHTQLRMNFEHPTRVRREFGGHHTQLRMNFEHPTRVRRVRRTTSNVQRRSARATRAADLDVGRSMLSVGRSSFNAWPSRTHGKPLRLLFPILRANGARGRIVLQNSRETA
jgi:hypothetical protein